MKMGVSDTAEVQEFMCNEKTIRQLDHEDEHKKNGLMTRVRPSSDDMIMSQSICLFRKYLVRKSRQQNITGKRNMEESEDNKKCWSGTRPPFPSELGRASSRPPSLLERQLLPRLRCSSGNDASDHNKASASSQLTIFYAGLVNVYEDVPAEKAQAIMLLAGSTSLSKAVITETPPPPPPPSSPKTDERVKTPPPPPPTHPSTLHSLPNKLKPRAGLIPMARRYSLQCFLEKRRGRIINKSPYAPPTTAANADLY